MEEYILPPNFNDMPRRAGTGRLIDGNKPGRSSLPLASISQQITVRSYFLSTRNSLQLLFLGCLFQFVYLWASP